MAIGNARLDTGRQADENCLKVVLTLHIEKGCAYISDVAEVMGIPVSTAYSMVNRLVGSGHLTLKDRAGGDRGPKQSAELTTKGETIAKEVLEKHKQIYEWLLCLGIPDEEADEEACHWEHSITDLTMQAIQHHVQMMHGRHGGPEAKAAIQKMMSSFEAAQQKLANSGSGRFILLLDQCGGIDGIQRKIDISNRAGGDAQLEALLDFIERQGGMQKLPEINALLRDVESRGGKKQYTAETELIESLGGFRKLVSLKKMADKLGGISAMMSLLRTNYRLWSAVITAAQSPSTEPNDE